MSFKVPDNTKRIPELEDQTIEFWKKNKTFEKSVDSRSSENLYVFYDGPPFISGLPHYGHLLGSIAKDIIPRYWTMRGKRVERVWGWDAHGLTVENKVQKKLGIKNRKDIVAYGLDAFTQECYTYTSETSAEWNWYVDKIGRWVDIENAYKTIDQSYMESVIWAFKQLYDKSLIYEGVRTSLFCTTCGTPVSNFEVAMDNTYKEVKDPSVIIKFKITSSSEFKGKYLLAWTTTPWTLPSNRGLVIDANETYVVVSYNDEEYILAQKRLENIFNERKYEVLSTLAGKELEGLEYEPPYAFFAANDKDFKVYSFDGMVQMEEGTGIVHSAPGFGMVDTDMGRYYGLTIMLTIDDEGSFIEGNNGKNPFKGMYYAKANKYISADLTERNLMFNESTIKHRFPYHDRCDTLLIQKAQNSWFVNIAELRSKLLDSNENINWVPEHLKYGRFQNGIEQAPDWCISRSRFWATPMPVWESNDGDRIVIGSIAELQELSGQEVKDLHRPYIDEITIEKGGKTYHRREEVLDSWFEAGSMPYAQLHYPFENEKKFENNFPGDYIVEYIAQTRAWFYVMHVLSNAIFETNSYKNVISTGVMSGNDGRKMSKSYGNYTDPKDVLTKIGGDALRLYLMGSPLMTGGNANFDEQELKTKLNNVLNPLWNSLKFFVMYANDNNWNPKDLVESNNVLDKWIFVRLNETIKTFVEGIENYMVPNAVQPLEVFVDDLSRWYVRRSRDRISMGDPEALSTLYSVLITLSKAVAPAIPFMSEVIYQHLIFENIDSEESVHLCNYPEYSTELVNNNEQLLKTMQNTREIVSLALSLRVENKIKVRQPLQSIFVEYSADSEYLYFEDLISDEVNVKSVADFNQNTGSLVSTENNDLKIYLDTNITHELLVEGASREIIRMIQDVRKKQGLKVSDTRTFSYESDDLNDEAVKIYGDYIKEKVSALELKPSDNFGILD